MAAKSRSRGVSSERAQDLFWRWMDFHYGARQAILLGAFPILFAFYLAGYRPTKDALDIFLGAISALAAIPALVAYMSARNVQRIFLRQPKWPVEFMSAFDPNFARKRQFPVQLVEFLARKRAMRAKGVVVLERTSLWFAQRATLLLTLGMLVALAMTITRVLLAG